MRFGMGCRFTANTFALRLRAATQLQCESPQTQFLPPKSFRENFSQTVRPVVLPHMGSGLVYGRSAEGAAVQAVMFERCSACSSKR